MTDRLSPPPDPYDAAFNLVPVIEAAARAELSLLQRTLDAQLQLQKDVLAERLRAHADNAINGNNHLRCQFSWWRGTVHSPICRLSTAVGRTWLDYAALAPLFGFDEGLHTRALDLIAAMQRYRAELDALEDAMPAGWSRRVAVRAWAAQPVPELRS